MRLRLLASFTIIDYSFIVSTSAAPYWITDVSRVNTPSSLCVMARKPQLSTSYMTSGSSCFTPDTKNGYAPLHFPILVPTCPVSAPRRHKPPIFARNLLMCVSSRPTRRRSTRSSGFCSCCSTGQSQCQSLYFRLYCASIPQNCFAQRMSSSRHYGSSL
jgi:hypothetical protein